MIEVTLYILTAIFAFLLTLAYKKWLYDNPIIAALVGVLLFIIILVKVTHPFIVNFKKDLNKPYEINSKDYSSLNDDYLIVKGSVKGEDFKNSILKAMNDNIIDNVEYENLTGRNVGYLVDSEKLKYKDSKAKLLDNLKDSGEDIALKVVQAISSNRVEIIDKINDGNILTYKVIANSRVCSVGVVVDSKKINSITCSNTDKNKLADYKLNDLEQYFTPNGKNELHETLNQI
ncbi:hypothetical protein GHT89_16545 [Acinetobacter baumannii]|uniref:hypothetical protein n=1 Tax=Acinetobacter baumannii TaxID=470 RepID=UPI00387DCC1A